MLGQERNIMNYLVHLFIYGVLIYLVYTLSMVWIERSWVHVGPENIVNYILYLFIYGFLKYLFYSLSMV